MMKLLFEPFPVLITKRLILRKMNENDASFIYDLRSNEEVNKFIDRAKTATKEQSADFIHKIDVVIEKKEGIYWLITLKGENVPVGTVSMWKFSTTENSAEIGYELMPQFQHQGIMNEALYEVLLYAFESIRLKKLYAWTHVNNKASYNLLEKNNFKRDGNAEKTHVNSYELTNMIIYSLSHTND